MPQVLIPLMIASTALGIGTTAYGLVNQPSAPAAPTPAQVTQDAINTETARRATATKEASQILPTLQYNTGGGLSPDAYQQLSAQFSGNADLANSPQMTQLINNFLGINTGASSSFGGSSSFGSGSTPWNPASPGLTA